MKAIKLGQLKEEKLIKKKEPTKWCGGEKHS